MQFSRKLLMASYRYPGFYTPPTNYTTQLLASTSGANYTTYTIPADGWYLVEVQGGAGGGSSSLPTASAGGKASRVVYLYQGQVCLLWSGSAPWGGNGGGPGGCGYPGTQNNTFGGQGATGTLQTSRTTASGTVITQHESGGGGGGACTGGRAGNTTSHVGAGGGGSGFIAGYTDKTMNDMSVTLGSMTVNINRSLTVGSVVSYTCISTYLMCGGGGGAANDNGSERASGGGGGAFGSGGTTYNPSSVAVSGPAGSWGKGADGGRYGGATQGAWAIVDFSTSTYTWGLGGDASDGYCKLSKVIPS